MISLSKNILDILVCPDCRGKIVLDGTDSLKCQSCNTCYYVTHNGNVDLRLKRTKSQSISFNIGQQEKSNLNFEVKKLTENPNPEVLFDTTDIPTHLTKELLSYFPRASSANSFVLDLGCGTTLHKNVCERAGFNYIGIDYENESAPYLGDAHALPFRDNSFEFVLSAAVLEHIQYPFLMMKEVFRVLQIGGTFIGSVAFLEPYHWDSYYHYTHLGLSNILTYAGFDIVQITPNELISVFDSQARLNSKVLFPRMPKKLAGYIISFPQIASNFWINTINFVKGRNYCDKNLYIYTSSFFFIARKMEGGKN